MPLSIVDKQSLSPQTIAELDKQVDALIERHRSNRYELKRLVFEGAAALTAGGNAQTQDAITADLLQAQYAAQQTLQRLADQ